MRSSPTRRRGLRRRSPNRWPITGAVGATCSAFWSSGLRTAAAPAAARIGTMKRIGDVIRTISIPIGTNTGGTSSAEEAVSCATCRDAGFIRYNVPLGHPKFGQLVPCQCREQEREGKRAEAMRQLSNLGAFGFLDHEFDAFDPY